MEIPLKQKKEIEEIRLRYKYLVGYTGSIGMANALDAFVLSAKIMDDKQIALVIVGKGPEKNNILNIVNDQQLTNVFLIDSIPKDSVNKFLSYFDFLFIGLKKQSLFRFGVSPNKLFDYMFSGKPIIQAIEAGNDMVSEAGCGITVEPESPDSIAEAINKLITLGSDEKIKMGEKGREYVLKNHDYRIISENYLKSL